MQPIYNIRQSETAVARERLLPYCQGDGLDIGFGGDPIRPEAICIDLPNKYRTAGTRPQNLSGDGTKLHWFRDNVFDYVYSSHLLEDFAETKDILVEWLRVIKPGGNLVLFLPDEQAYRAFCTMTGQRGNQHHVYANFSYEFVRDIINTIENTEIIYHSGIVNLYCFDVVVKKK
jgi:predicted SAM-dependent methyltransferase